MIRGIDHLVIACADPDAAAAELESSLGVVSTGGGRHAGSGTWNRIAWLADGQLPRADRGRRSRRGAAEPVGAAAVRALDDAGGGLATYALRVDDLEPTVAGLRAAGSSIGAGHPREPDPRRWRGRRVVDVGARGAARSRRSPFLIEHAYSGAEWGPAALGERARFVHPIGSPVLLARLDVAALDPPSLAADLHAELELDFWAVADLAVADVGPHVIRLVPRREMALPAVVTLGAEVASPRTAELLGLRLDVERGRDAASPPAEPVLARRPAARAHIRIEAEPRLGDRRVQGGGDAEASTRRVSSGSMTPSSQSRAVEW